MKNTAIFNKKTDTIEIDLVGEFGDGFWGEEITKEKIINISKDNPTANITANLSSLGGSVDTALAARDWIRMHKGHTKVRMLGRNASASAFFSTGFDEVEISDSGMFLIHNVWGMAIGDAEDFRKQADEFDAHNNIIVNIFKKKTGKSSKEIEDLMSEDKWITAEEAKDWGFADAIFTPDKKDSKFNFTQQSIYNQYLPKLNGMSENETGLVLKDEKGFFDKIGNYFKPEIKDISDDTKKEYDNKLLKASETETELKAKIAEFEKNDNAEEITAKTKEIETLKSEVSELNTKLAAYANKGIEPKSKDDKLGTGEMTEEEKAWNNEALNMKNEMTNYK